MRKDWPSFFIGLAHMYAQQSTCASGRRVGCVMTRGNRQISAGFNGVPAKVEHPKNCERLIYGIPSGQGLDRCQCHHAEHNAIKFAKENNVDIVGADVWVTSQPCDFCADELVDAKVGRVFYDVPYPDSKSISTLGKAGISCEPFQNETLRTLPTPLDQCNFLASLVVNERGLDKIAKLLPALYPDPHVAERYVRMIVKATKVFNGLVYDDVRVDGYGQMKVEVDLYDREGGHTVTIESKPCIIEGLSLVNNQR